MRAVSSQHHLACLKYRTSLTVLCCASFTGELYFFFFFFVQQGSMSTNSFVYNVNLRHNMLLKRSNYRFPSMLLDKLCCYSSYKSLPIYKGASLNFLQDCFCLSVHDNKRHSHGILTVAQTEQKCENMHFSATWAVNTGLVSARGCGQWQTLLQPASNQLSLRWIQYMLPCISGFCFSTKAIGYVMLDTLAPLQISFQASHSLALIAWFVNLQ